MTTNKSLHHEGHEEHEVEESLVLNPLRLRFEISELAEFFCQRRSVGAVMTEH